MFLITQAIPSLYKCSGFIDNAVCIKNAVNVLKMLICQCTGCYDDAVNVMMKL